MSDRNSLAIGTTASHVEAAMHLIALIEFNLRDRQLYGDRITAGKIESHVEAAISCFLRAFAKQ